MSLGLQSNDFDDLSEHDLASLAVARAAVNERERAHRVLGWWTLKVSWRCVFLLCSSLRCACAQAYLSEATSLYGSCAILFFFFLVHGVRIGSGSFSQLHWIEGNVKHADYWLKAWLAKSIDLSSAFYLLVRTSPSCGHSAECGSFDRCTAC